MKIYLSVLLLLCSIVLLSQSLDSTSVSYKGDTLSVYIAGQLFDPNFPNGGGRNNGHKAISSIQYSFSGDTILMDVFFFPCGPLIQIVPYDSLIKEQITLIANRSKTLIIYTQDTIEPNCITSGSYVDTSMLTFLTPLSQTELATVNKIDIYPNPVKTTIKINAPSGLRINQVTIKNLSGQAVKMVVDFNGDKIDVSHLPIGIYLVEIETEQGIAVRKVLIE